MKAKQFNGQVKTWRRLPDVWEDENGKHLNFRKADHKKYGFYDVVTPSYDKVTQRLGAIEFDSENEVFTYPIVDIDLDSTYDIEELKSNKKKEVNEEAGRLLKDTDWYIIRKAERDVEIPSEVAAERLDVITKANDFIAAIDELTTVESVLKYTFNYNPTIDPLV